MRCAGTSETSTRSYFSSSLALRRDARRAAHLDVDVLVLERASGDSRRCPARAGRRPRRRGRSAGPSPARSSRPRCSASRCRARPSRGDSLYVVAAGVLGVGLELDEVLALAQRRRSSTARGRWGTRPAGARASRVCGSVDHTSAVTSYGWPTLMSSGTVTPTTRTSSSCPASNVRHETWTPSSLRAIGLDREVAFGLVAVGDDHHARQVAVGDRGRRRAASPPGCRCRRRRRRGARSPTRAAGRRRLARRRAASRRT